MTDTITNTINEVYTERNRVVAALAKILSMMGSNVGVAKTNIEGWLPEWHTCVFIDLPRNEGQLSWHFHDSDAYLLDGLPEYKGKWDGHTTEQKYEDLARYTSLATYSVTQAKA